MGDGSAAETRRSELRQQVEERGFAIVPQAITEAQVLSLRRAVSDLTDGRRGGVAGVRNLLSASESVRSLSRSDTLRAIVSAILGPNCFAVRALLFDKSPTANWDLGFHQDGVIAVADRVEADGYHGWSEKAGVTHVRPPEAVLREMLAIRVHLDDCGATNGPLRVLPGTHTRRLDEGAVSEASQRIPAERCCVAAGDVLVMRPLLVHASSRATAPRHRRVIHLEYAASDLPGGLAWHERVVA